MHESIEGATAGDIPPDDMAKEEKRKRVNMLPDGDNKDEDSVVYDLAEAEGSIRAAFGGLVRGDANLDEKNIAFDKASDSVLEAMEKMKEAKKAGWMDDLTGLRNQNACNAEIPSFIRIEKRRKGNCAFIFLDLDKFKEVNDTLGHEAGNQALKKIASIITEAARSTDVVYRYAGDEFLIYLPDSPLQGAIDVARRIQQLVASTEFKVSSEGNEVVLEKTVSIGCAGTDQEEEWKRSFKADPKEFEEFDANKFMKMMIEHADKAMYTAKGSGGNQVIVYSPDLEKSEDTEKK